MSDGMANNGDKGLRVRVAYTATFDDEALRAYCRYHSIDPTKRRAVAEHVRGSLEGIGNDGVDEQIYEGRRWLEHDEQGEDFESLD